MAATKKILKLTHHDATVKVTAASADNATVSVGTDLKLGSETITTAKVSIEKLLWSVSHSAGTLTITRNSEVIATLYGTGEMDLNAKGMVEDSQSGSDLVVAFAGSGGTVF